LSLPTKRLFNNMIPSADAEKAITEMIDWLVEKYARVWNNIIDYTQRQASANEKQVVGSLRTQYAYNRQALITGTKKQQNRDTLTRSLPIMLRTWRGSQACCSQF